MMSQEVNGLVFTAEDRVPADFFVELVEGFDDFSIEEIKKEENGLEYDLTICWDDYLENIKTEIDYLFENECNSVKKYMKEYINKKF